METLYALYLKYNIYVKNTPFFHFDCFVSKHRNACFYESRPVDNLNNFIIKTEG